MLVLECMTSCSTGNTFHELYLAETLDSITTIRLRYHDYRVPHVRNDTLTAKVIFSSYSNLMIYFISCIPTMNRLSPQSKVLVRTL
jgi:hypothetical protein